MHITQSKHSKTKATEQPTAIPAAAPGEMESEEVLEVVAAPAVPVAPPATPLELELELELTPHRAGVQARHDEADDPPVDGLRVLLGHAIGANDP